MDGAVQLFQVNAELFPWASAPHVGLGWARLAAGDMAAAVASALRALKVAPTDGDARALLRRVGVEPPAREPVALTPEALAAFVGRYALDPEFTIDVTREGARLYVQGTGQSRDELVPVTASRFEIVAWGVEIAFWSGDGSSPALTLYQHGRALVAERAE